MHVYVSNAADYLALVFSACHDFYSVLVFN